MRECEKEIGRRYGRWKVVGERVEPRPARHARRRRARRPSSPPAGGACAAGHGGPPGAGRWMYESFPYLALVGAPELGYDVERPIYKRKPRHLAPRRVPGAARGEHRRDRAAGRDALRPADRPAVTRRDRDPARRADAARRSRREAPRGPARRRAVRVDRAALVAPRPRPLPGPRRRGGGDDGRRGGAPPTATVIAPCRPEQRR